MKLYKIVFTMLFSVFLVAACATQSGYYNSLNKLVGENKFSEAVALNESSKMKEYGEKNALLYYFDRGILLHYYGDYLASNEAFERAKKLAEDYFTKSVTTEASTLLISDNMRPYYGEDFERALIHVFSALNYVFLRQESEALVEARQVDHFLKTLKVNYGYKNVYTEDAFARYLMGMIYENQGQLNDAYISYVQAINAYENYKKYYQMPVSQDLINDAIKSGTKLGFTQEVADLKSKYKTEGKPLESGSSGELVVVHYNGIAPTKIDNFFEISFGKGWAYVESADVKGEEESQVENARAMARSVASDEQVRIAFPKYAAEPYTIKSVELKTEGQLKSGVLCENIGAIAVQNLDDRIGRIRARAIARGIIKFVLAQKISNKVQESQGEALGWLAKTALKAVSTATELSDKRCWRSLPDRINIARITLPEGDHSIEVLFKDSQGSIVTTQTLKDIHIKKGKKSFAAVRTAL